MRLIAGMVLALCGAAAGVAQQQTLTVNPGASQVHMTLNTTHEVVNGTFHVASGSVAFERGKPEMTGLIVVQAGSGNTGSSARDRKMNNDILLVNRYSTILFEPKSYTGAIPAAGDATIKIAGVFTLLGTTHEIEVPAQVHVENGSASAKAHFTIPYVQWGLKDPSFLIWKADKEVGIDLELKGSLSH